MADWSHVPAAWRFVGGRRRHNAQRRAAAEDRRRRLVDLVCERDGNVTQRQLAVDLRVHEITVSRDVRYFEDGCWPWRLKITWGRTLGRW